MAAIVGIFGWLRRKLTGRKNPTDAHGQQDELTPTDEAYQQVAAGQQSTNPDDSSPKDRSKPDLEKDKLHQCISMTIHKNKPTSLEQR